MADEIFNILTGNTAFAKGKRFPKGNREHTGKAAAAVQAPTAPKPEPTAADIDSQSAELICVIPSPKCNGQKPHECLPCAVDSEGHEQTVQVTGDAVQPAKSFTEFLGSCKHADKLLSNIHECGFASPTTIQQYAMPCAVDGKDMYAIAPTGSGKTLAFLLPGKRPVHPSRSPAVHHPMLAPVPLPCSCPPPYAAKTDTTLQELCCR